MADDVLVARRRGSFIRSWLRRIVVIVGVPGLAAIWLWPSDRFVGGTRMMSTVLVVLLIILLMGIWLIGFSGYSWFRRLGLFFVPLGTLAAASGALVQEVRFTGDMTPVFHFRWQAGQAD